MAKAEIVNLEKEAKEIDKFQRKVKIVNDLLDKHIYWTNFFTFLEDNLLTNVYLDSTFEGNTDGSFNLTSKAKSFTDLTNQSRVFRKSDKVSNLQISSGEVMGSVEEKGKEVEFDLNLEVDPSIFYK